MSHVKSWACIKPGGDGCNGEHIRLKSCPFCGGKKIEIFNGSKVFYVICDECLANTGLYNSTTAALKAWKRRVRKPAKNRKKK